MTPSFWQIAVVLVLIVLLFGRGKISDLMGDVAKGIKSFKKGMSDDEPESGEDLKTINHDQDSETISTEDNKNRTAKSS